MAIFPSTTDGGDGADDGATAVVRPLIPIMVVVFVAFLIIGLAMPVLPLHVHQGLGMGTVIVGLVAGSQFAASLVSRVSAGHFSDSRGAKPTVIAGMTMAAVSGALYLVSLGFVSKPIWSVSILLAGRALLGAAESFIITGALGWGLALAGPRHTGKVMAWIGTAMYGAFAIGAPLGTALYSWRGFQAIALATMIVPLLTLLMVLPLPAVRPQRRPQTRMLQVVAAVWLPGVGLAFASVGFGAITAFITLLFADQGWTPGWLAFTVFAGAFMAARILLGHLSDQLGGARVALVCIIIETVGQAMIWLAPNAAVALTGAALSGLGYSLVYPALGVEAVRLAPPQNRGLAMGAYTAFLDLALGVASPLLGLVAGRAGMPRVFMTSALLVACSSFIAMALRRATTRQPR